MGLRYSHLMNSLHYMPIVQGITLQRYSDFTSLITVTRMQYFPCRPRVTVLYCSVQYNSVQYSTVQYSTVQTSCHRYITSYRNSGSVSVSRNAGISYIVSRCSTVQCCTVLY